MKSKKRWILAALTLVYLIGIFRLVDFKDVIGLFPKISAKTLLGVATLAILAHLLALARSRSALKAFHFTVNWRDIYLAFAAGNLATLAFNVFGQSLSRAVILQNAGVPFGITVLATYIERILAASILLVLSIIAAWILFSGLEIDLYRGIGDLITACVGIVVVTVSVAFIALRDHAFAGSVAGLRLMLRLGPSTVWTILGLACGLGAYLVLFYALDPSSISLKLIAALTIVMLATSLPISFAGFGLRELSAAATLTFVGIDPATAVAASVLIGIVYIIIAGLFGVAALPVSPKSNAAEAADNSAAKAARPLVNDAFIIQCLSIACAILIFFRIRAPVAGRDVLININVADILVFMALTVIVLMVAVGRLRALLPPRVVASMVLLTATIGSGLISAFVYGHLAGWAIYTRGWGWVVLLGYVALGAATTRLAGDIGRERVTNSLMVASVTICVLQLVASAINYVHPLPYYILSVPLQGFAHNQNAFAFDLIISGVLLIVARHYGALRDRQTLFLFSMAVIVAAIFLTESRTGIVFAIILAAMDLALWLVRRARGDVSWPVSTVAIVTAFVMLSVGVPVSTNTAANVAVPTRNFSAETVTSAPVETTRFDHPHADRERWDTIISGLQAWKTHPVFGAGIGAYFESLRRDGWAPKGIHSIYVWFLSEMGIVGLLALITSAGLLTYSAWTGTIALDNRWGFIALGSLAFMGIGGLVQDFSYQRIFWFVLGLSLAVPQSLQKSRELFSDKLFVGAAVLFTALLLIISIH